MWIYTTEPSDGKRETDIKRYEENSSSEKSMYVLGKIY